MSGPLEGLKVLDIATIVAAPFAATLLADYGADVLKIEMPGQGDGVRAFPPFWWKCVNRNKKFAILDLRKPEGLALFKRTASPNRCSTVCHAEPVGRTTPTAHTLIFHSPNNAKAKVWRDGFGHGGWPPSPAPNVNHDLPRSGIRSDSNRSGKALVAATCLNHFRGNPRR